ncbi:MAG: N-6 DNA methylase, partial [bacterium]|nr:N-6 DNA methylase [bacterium]
TQSGEGDIRRAMIEGEVIDCMIALPGQLFYSTQIPACLWFLAKDKSNGVARDKKLRDRRGEVLFIDARKLGFMVDRTRKEFSAADVSKIADTYHAWRLGEGYEDIAGFCKSASIDEIRSHGHVLTPGRYVGAEAVEEDDTPFADRFAALQDKLEEQFAQADQLTATIRERFAAVMPR